jgi:hypothetical protein
MIKQILYWYEVQEKKPEVGEIVYLRFFGDVDKIYIAKLMIKDNYFLWDIGTDRYENPISSKDLWAYKCNELFQDEDKSTDHAKEELEDKEYVKPPLGLVPRKLHLESRRNDIIAAIYRYNMANKQLPIDWTDELSDILIKIGSIEYIDELKE